MNTDYIKGFSTGVFILVCYKVVSDYRFLKIRADELERRIDTLEDFRLHFYQMHTVRDNRVWDNEETEESELDDDLEESY
jgi:hypothetical protein